MRSAMPAPSVSGSGPYDTARRTPSTIRSTVEENPRLCGWGAEVASIVADERDQVTRRAGDKRVILKLISR
jgi:hypothetical protein